MNRSIWQKAAAFAVVMLLGSMGAAVAQQQVGSIYVEASDTEGAAMPGVTVTVTGYGAPRVHVTNANGQARFLSLDPGQYGLSAELEGFSTLEYPSVDVRIGRNTNLELTLSAAVEETITVTSESPLLDERKIQTGTTISSIELEKIPTETAECRECGAGFTRFLSPTKRRSRCGDCMIARRREQSNRSRGPGDGSL